MFKAAGNRIILTVMIILNVVVLMGQIWPQAAPPFARSVNVIFLVLSLALFLVLLLKRPDAGAFNEQ